MEHKKFKLKYEKFGVEKYLFVKSYCGRKGCSGSSTKRSKNIKMWKRKRI